MQRLHDDAFRRSALGVGFGAKEIREASLEGPYRYSAELPIDITGWDHGLQLAKNLERIHRNTLVDFFDSDFFGAVTDDSTAIGFAAHGPTRLKYSLQIGAPVQGAPPWQLTRLELVSLLRHDEPRVYVAETIPS